MHARGVVRDTPATVALIIAASAIVVTTYALGCRTFRLRLSLQAIATDQRLAGC
jgi:hypothetical protein